MIAAFADGALSGQVVRASAFSNSGNLFGSNAAVILPARWSPGKDVAARMRNRYAEVTSYKHRRTETVQVKRILAAAVTTFLLAGCSAGENVTCSIDLLNRPADVVTQPEVAEVSESASNVGLDVQSTLEKRVRLTVRFDGTLALDIAMPGTPSECSHQAVYKYAYQLHRGQTTVAATTDRGQRETTTLTVGDDKRWVIVLVQEGFPLEVKTWDSQPLWG
jgi:hypothetical protein